ncbi:sensor histidine kinase [Flaviflagellibacter deserti]|uniref:histidine kinase n=1 Tax=Flaviflagellibacter deserti TaxID=2267266 RepID=A0ABV9Z2K0_9HYPH
MKARGWSLRRRLIFRLSLVLVLGTIIPVMVVIFRAAESIDTMSDRTLQDQATDIVRAFDTKTGTLSVPDTLARSYQSSNDGFLYAVFDKSGNAIASSSPRAVEVLKTANKHPAEDFFALNPVGATGGPWYAYHRPVGDYSVAVAQSGIHDDVLADSVVGELARESTPVLFAVMLFGIAVVWITLRQAFREVDAAADVAESMRPGEGVPTLATSRMPIEIRPFVDAVASAIQRLETALDSERRFIANAAHEIRTPLSILTARIDRLPPGEDRKVLAGDADRINRLVQQLLEVARLDASTLKSDRVFDLRDVVVEAVAEIAPLAVKDGREIAVTGETGALPVRADPHAIAVALRNLLENALKHTPRGSPIEIELVLPATARVNDRGPGIAEGDRERLFRRFQRGATQAPGTGLGLAITHEIMRQHQGSIRIEARPGGGSSFVLDLPTERVVAG